MSRKARIDFNLALNDLPLCLAGGLDPLGQHKTVADLLFMAQCELDLHDEGDIELSNSDRRAVERFIKKWAARKSC